MYKSYQPAEELAPFVECYWSWRIEPNDTVLDDILPDASPELIVHLGATPCAEDAQGNWQKQAQAFLYCAAREPLRLSVREPMAMFAIRFRPWGVGRFSATSMVDMLDRPVSPGEALNELGDELVMLLAEQNSDSARVETADNILTGALQSGSRIEPRLKKLLDAAGGGRCGSSEMARKLDLSDRSFSRLWKDVVGIQPRQFVQLMRFHQALELIDRGVALKDVAAECGFSDQAHMARQIKSIAGLPPSSLKRRLGSTVYRELYAERPDAPWR